MDKNTEYVGVDDKFVPENDQNENNKNEKVKNDGKKALTIGIVCFAAVIGIVFIITFVFIFKIFSVSLGFFNKADKMMDRTLNTTDKVVNKTIDKMIYDTSSCQLEPTDWVFNFDSIAESYAWLSRRNRNLEKERKVIEISSPNTYNDSDKEINYLSEYILLAKKGMKISTIYIGTKEDIEKKKQNRYFNILTRKTGDNVKTYFCDINNLKEREPELFNKIKDGIAIYEDCVYKDTFDSEFSLGIVDCKLESVKEYSDIFDYILSNYCVLLVEGGNYVGI